MELTRRAFGTGFGKVGLLAAIGSTLFTVGCGIVSEIANYVGIGLNAFNVVVDILVQAGIINMGEGTAIEAIVNLVKAGFGDIAAAIAAYDNAPADQKQTLLGKISTVISIVIANIQQFWNDLKIPDPKLANTVKDLLSLILSTLAGFLSQLPKPAAKGAEAEARVKALPNAIPVKAQIRKSTDFRHEFNSILSQNGYGQKI